MEIRKVTVSGTEKQAASIAFHIGQPNERLEPAID